MRSIERIKEDISIVEQAIREANICGDVDQAELFYEDLDELYEELRLAKTTAI